MSIPRTGIRSAGAHAPADAAASPPLQEATGGEACRREHLRLEANKAFAASILEMTGNPVLAAREYRRYVRDLNAAINVHNAVCKHLPVTPLPL